MLKLSFSTIKHLQNISKNLNGIKMEARLINANGILQYRLNQSYFIVCGGSGFVCPVKAYAQQSSGAADKTNHA
jgi:hypothetical protein